MKPFQFFCSGILALSLLSSCGFRMSVEDALNQKTFATVVGVTREKLEEQIDFDGYTQKGETDHGTYYQYMIAHQARILMFCKDENNKDVYIGMTDKPQEVNEALEAARQKYEKRVKTQKIKENNAVYGLPLSDYGKLSGTFAWALKDSLWGLIDAQGNEILPFKYKNLEGGIPDVCDRRYEYIQFNDGMAVVRNLDGKYGFINKQGDEVIPCIYTRAERFREGLAPVYTNNAFSYVDMTGKVVLKTKYEGGEPFSEGMAVVYTHSGGRLMCGYIDRKGKEIIKCKYYDKEGNYAATGFSEGLAAVSLPFGKNETKWGYINKSGKVFVKPQIPFNANQLPAFPFHKGLAIVGGANGSYRVIDKIGRQVIRQVFTYSEDRNAFAEGYAVISESLPTEPNCRYFVIDRKGKPVFTEYDNVESLGFSKGMLGVEKEGKWGFINAKGKLLVPCLYDKVLPFESF